MICTVLMTKGKSNHFVDYYYKLKTQPQRKLEEKYFEIWSYETGKKETSEEWRFFARYHLQGCLSIIERWVESNFAYPKDSLTKLILTIDTNFDNIIPQ